MNQNNDAAKELTAFYNRKKEQEKVKDEKIEKLSEENRSLRNELKKLKGTDPAHAEKNFFKRVTKLYEYLTEDLAKLTSEYTGIIPEERMVMLLYTAAEEVRKHV